MPNSPPKVLPTKEANIESAPNSMGAYPPAMEHITIAIMIKLFLDMVSPLGLSLRAEIRKRHFSEVDVSMNVCASG